jgi:hypothetical protein
MSANVENPILDSAHEAFEPSSDFDQQSAALNSSTSLQGTKIHSEKLNIDFTVYVQDQTIKTQQRCYMMTVHDLGCDCKMFKI